MLFSIEHGLCELRRLLLSLDCSVDELGDCRGGARASALTFRLDRLALRVDSLVGLLLLLHAPVSFQLVGWAEGRRRRTRTSLAVCMLVTLLAKRCDRGSPRWLKP